MVEVVVAALVGPIVVGTILDLWLRPRVEAKKTQHNTTNVLRRSKEGDHSLVRVTGVRYKICEKLLRI